MELRIVDCGTERTLMPVLLVIQMSIGLEVWIIERALQVAASILETILFLGRARNKILCLSLQLMPNMQLLEVVIHDYGITQDTMCVFCDNTSAINLSKNPVQHSKSKHIEMRYHFIRDLVEDKVVCLEFIHTDNQKADIFTKPLDGPWFESLRKTISVGTIP